MAYATGEQRLVAFGGRAGVQGAYWSLADQWELSSLSPAAVSIRNPGSCPGSLGVLSLGAAPYSQPWVGDAFAVVLDNLPVGSFPFLVIGFSTTQTNLSSLGLNNCWQFVSADSVRGLPLTGHAVTTAIFIPVMPNFVGASFYLQGAALNAGGQNVLGAAVGNDLRATVGMR
jgi:hypothetical protein